MSILMIHLLSQILFRRQTQVAICSVNKYGDVKTQTELAELQRTEENSEQFLITKGTLYKKYAFDNLSTPINSTPAQL